MKTPSCSGSGSVCAFAVGLLLLAGTGFAGATALHTFNVREFGAKGDGRALDTAAIQQALDAAGKAGGGIVR